MDKVKLEGTIAFTPVIGAELIINDLGEAGASTLGLFINRNGLGGGTNNLLGSILNTGAINVGNLIGFNGIGSLPGNLGFMGIGNPTGYANTGSLSVSIGLGGIIGNVGMGSIGVGGNIGAIGVGSSSNLAINGSLIGYTGTGNLTESIGIRCTTGNTGIGSIGACAGHLFGYSNTGRLPGFIEIGSLTESIGVGSKISIGIDNLFGYANSGSLTGFIGVGSLTESIGVGSKTSIGVDNLFGYANIGSLARSIGVGSLAGYSGIGNLGVANFNRDVAVGPFNINANTIAPCYESLGLINHNLSNGIHIGSWLSPIGSASLGTNGYYDSTVTRPKPRFNPNREVASLLNQLENNLSVENFGYDWDVEYNERQIIFNFNTYITVSAITGSHAHIGNNITYKNK